MFALLVLAVLAQSPDAGITRAAPSPDAGVQVMPAPRDGGSDVQIPPEAVGLSVYRSRDQLPKDSAAKVPARFNFRRYMLAGEGGQIVEPEKVERRDGATIIYVGAPAPKRDCPCSGIYRRDPIEPAMPIQAEPFRPRALYRVPRAVGPVYLVVIAAPPPEPCPPCARP